MFFFYINRADYDDLGDPVYQCQFCKAYFWIDERRHGSTILSPKYSLCCQNGKVRLPRLERPPTLLGDLLWGNHAKSKHFQQNIRSYNSMFAFTSMGGTIDFAVNNGGGPPTFRLSGQNYHLIGSLMPLEGKPPLFGQMYIYDTENEIANRMQSVR